MKDFITKIHGERMEDVIRAVNHELDKLGDVAAGNGSEDVTVLHHTHDDELHPLITKRLGEIAGAHGCVLGTDGSTYEIVKAKPSGPPDEFMQRGAVGALGRLL